jgi:hypothetical protein
MPADAEQAEGIPHLSFCVHDGGHIHNKVGDLRVENDQLSAARHNQLPLQLQYNERLNN